MSHLVFEYVFGLAILSTVVHGLFYLWFQRNHRIAACQHSLDQLRIKKTIFKKLISIYIYGQFALYIVVNYIFDLTYEHVGFEMC